MTKTAKRTLNDFPAWTAGQSKLKEITDRETDLSKQIDRVQEERHFQHGPRPSIQRAAEQFLAGGNVATEPIPDLVQLRSELEVVRTAKAMQTDRNERIRQKSAEAIASDYLEDDQRRVTALIGAAKNFLDAFDSLNKLRSQCKSATQDFEFLTPPLKDIGLNASTISPLRLHVTAFEKAAIEANYILKKD